MNHNKRCRELDGKKMTVKEFIAKYPELPYIWCICLFKSRNGLGHSIRMDELIAMNVNGELEEEGRFWVEDYYDYDFKYQDNRLHFEVYRRQ